VFNFILIKACVAEWLTLSNYATPKCERFWLGVDADDTVIF
jgi:hypothetical protein